MITKILAKIKLYKGKNKRKTAFKTNYRPMFDSFYQETKISGMIILLNNEDFQPGEEKFVEIKFLHVNCVKYKKFYFYEGKEALGEGIVIKCLDEL